MLNAVDPGLLAVLRAHNPWLDRPQDQSALLAASLPDQLVARRRTLALSPGQAELVVGPRQTGKSTLIRAALARREEPVLVLHAEEPRIRELAESPGQAVESIRGVLEDRTVILLEEVQHLRDAALFLKGLVDLDRRRRVVATGSSSFELRSRTRESLAGRARRTLLLPFSLEEVAATLPAGLPAVREHHLAMLWGRLLVTGGYPGPWFDAEPEASLRRLVEAFALRDASDFYAVERPSAFRKLLELAAADIGNLVNLSAWASLAGVSRSTAERYLQIAEQAHLLRLVPPFTGGKRSEVTGAPKAFFLDNGLRNAVFAGFAPLDERPDRGALWENGVFAELAKRVELLDEIRHWRTTNQAEVDLVIRRRARLVAVEVKAGELARPRISRAARSFAAAYRPACLAVVNASLRLDTEVEGVPVRFLRPWELELILAALEG